MAKEIVKQDPAKPEPPPPPKPERVKWTIGPSGRRKKMAPVKR